MVQEDGRDSRLTSAIIRDVLAGRCSLHAVGGGFVKGIHLYTINFSRFRKLKAVYAKGRS
jgi:hypothetical protein